MGLAMKRLTMPTMVRRLAPAALAVSGLLAQTQVDLRTQGKSVDFSGAALTKPVRTGTALPETCQVGEAFLKTDAAAGEGLHWCTAGNTWTRQNPNAVDRTQAGSFSAGARQTFQPSASAAGVRIAPGALPSSGLAGDLAVDASDSYALKVYDGSQWVAASGLSGGTAGDTVAPGVGITITGTSPKQISVDTAAVPAFLTVSTTADFPSISAGGCQEVAVPLLGAAVGDAVAVGWPALATGLVGMARVGAPDAVTLRLCNVSGTAIDPPMLVYRTTVVRSF